jgi:Tfp pilus assembly protein PilO
MKKRFVSLGLVCLIALLAWFVAAFRPAHSELGKLHTDVDAAKAKVSSLQSQLQTLIALKNDQAHLRTEATRFATALPKDPKVSDFIIQVQNAANAAGIDFLTITPSLPAVPAALAAATTPTAPTTPTDGSAKTSSTDGNAAAAAPATPETPLRSISIQIRADGHFFEIEDFTLKLEQLARALRIDQFGLTGGNEENGELLSATMTLQIFMVTPQTSSTPTQTTTGTSGSA